MATKALIPFLVAMMLVTGVCNTILTKYQDMVCVSNCDSSDPKQRKAFEQPVWQTVQMFIGEMGCWLVVAASAIYRRYSSSRAGYEPIDTQPRGSLDGSREDGAPAVMDGEVPMNGSTTVNKPLSVTEPDRLPLRGWRVLLLALPACCDLTATTLMNVGLLLVAASIYQMTRGALVLFVGLFSVLFLSKRLQLAKWMALFIVTGGICIVGLAGAIEQKPALLPGHDGSPRSGKDSHEMVKSALNVARAALAADDGSAAVKTVFGIMLIFGAQIFTASQFVLEEAIMHRYALTPLAVVGWEGTFGLVATLIVQLILHLVVGRTPAGRGGYFDATTGWKQMTGITAVWVSSLLIMLSIGGFNYFGLSVTRNVSATSRSTIDTCRTLFIWMISLGLGWETFKWLQVLGFAGLVYGTFLFNDIVRPPACAFWRKQTASIDELHPARED